MKAWALLAPLLLSGLLLLPFASAAFTITVATDKSSYSGTATIRVTGTISGGTIPSGTSVSIQIRNPQNTLVDAGTAPVDPATGAYSKDFVAGGPSWSVPGTYTVTVSWAPDLSTPPISASTIFTYTPAGPIGVSLSVQVSASALAFPGQTVWVALLATWSNGSLAEVSNFPMAHYRAPDGSLVELGTPTRVHRGLYVWSISLPSNAPDGGYAVHIVANASNVLAHGLAMFTVNSQVAKSSEIAALSGKIGSAVANLTSAISAVSGKIDSAVSTLSGKVDSAVSTLSSKIDSAVASLTSAISAVSDKIDSAVSTLTSTVNSAVSTLSSKIDSAVSTLSGKVDSAVSSLTSTVNSAVSTLSSKIDSAVSSIQASVGSLSTYVIALIVIAVIVLALQIVTLARRRS